ncbi:hypothetical protein CVT26_010556 [Gymnopilus dilepis]|uniref:Uncharacterized protein n=1 Tax=Gymnopilus dilepis TaxID=231916 RepID=A0A409VZA5_9AGAR|nr:hypothetical protein CVT26_010556 [Gymnopilus dilepis]
MSHQQPSLPPQSLLLQPLQSQPHPGQPSLPQPAQQIHQPVPQPAQRLRVLPTTLRQPEGAQVPRQYIIPYNDAGILEADSLLRFIAYYTRTVVAIMPEVQIPPQDLHAFHQLLESLLDHCDNAENDLVFICNILQAENVVRRFLALICVANVQAEMVANTAQSPKYIVTIPMLRKMISDLEDIMQSVQLPVMSIANPKLKELQERADARERKPQREQQLEIQDLYLKVEQEHVRVQNLELQHHLQAQHQMQERLQHKMQVEHLQRSQRHLHFQHQQQMQILQELLQQQQSGQLESHQAKQEQLSRLQQALQAQKQEQVQQKMQLQHLLNQPRPHILRLPMEPPIQALTSHFQTHTMQQPQQPPLYQDQNSGSQVQSEHQSQPQPGNNLESADP